MILGTPAADCAKSKKETKTNVDSKNTETIFGKMRFKWCKAV